MAKKRNIYLVNGSRVPSVTAITGILHKPQLMYWAVRVAIESLEANIARKKAWRAEELIPLLQEAKYAHVASKDSAGKFGSRVHEIIEALIGGQDLSIINADEKRAMENFMKVTVGWKWLGSEIVLSHPVELFGGTADALAEIDGKITLVDFKTSSGVYPEHELQLCAYKHSTPENLQLISPWSQIRDCKIVHLEKETLGWEVLERSVDHHWETFQHLRKVYDWVKDHSY